MTLKFDDANGETDDIGLGYLNQIGSAIWSERHLYTFQFSVLSQLQVFFVSIAQIRKGYDFVSPGCYLALGWFQEIW